MKTPIRSVSLAAFLGSSLIVLASPAAATELYKCAGEGGIPLYQNMPCEKGKELRNMTGEDTLSVVPMRVEPSRLPPPPPPAAPPAAPATPAPAPTTAVPLPAPLPNTLPPPNAPEAPKEAAPASVGTPPPAAGMPEATPLGAVALARMTVKPGMTTAEVEASLGAPPMTGGGETPDQPMRWFYLPTEGDEGTITTIVFLRGKVTDVERKPMKR
ncbi:MAG: hypothetical protein FWC38_05675 [Proteobacteria bacterium]|nr:hypothetical protein [Pseudomonadota bacterium]MCL2307704.1 hypothetical protein [Pseudomonadota bacterium]